MYLHQIDFSVTRTTCMSFASNRSFNDVDDTQKLMFSSFVLACFYSGFHFFLIKKGTLHYFRYVHFTTKNCSPLWVPFIAIKSIVLVRSIFKTITPMQWWKIVVNITWYVPLAVVTCWLVVVLLLLFCYRLRVVQEEDHTMNTNESNLSKDFVQIVGLGTNLLGRGKNHVLVVSSTSPQSALLTPQVVRKKGSNAWCCSFI